MSEWIVCARSAGMDPRTAKPIRMVVVGDDKESLERFNKHLTERASWISFRKFTYEEGHGMYEMFGLPDGPWRNDACMGYALMAMNRAEVDDETVRKVMLQMHYCFDDTSVEEAAEYYCGKR